MDRPSKTVAAETHELYLHLLNLQQPTGGSATDSVQLHRDIVNAPEGREAKVDAASLAAFCAGTANGDDRHLAAIRTILDRAHLHAFNPKFWRPRWLKSRQSVTYQHPHISDHALHHHPAV